MQTIDIFYNEKDAENNVNFELTVGIRIAPESYKLFGKGQLLFSELVAITEIKTTKPVPGEVPKGESKDANGILYIATDQNTSTTYHLSVKHSENKQLILKTDEESFTRVKDIFRKSIVDEKEYDQRQISLKKWFFNADPNVV